MCIRNLCCIFLYSMKGVAGSDRSIQGRAALLLGLWYRNRNPLMRITIIVIDFRVLLLSLYIKDASLFLYRQYPTSSDSKIVAIIGTVLESGKRRGDGTDIL